MNRKTKLIIAVGVLLVAIIFIIGIIYMAVKQIGDIELQPYITNTPITENAIPIPEATLTKTTAESEIIVNPTPTMTIETVVPQATLPPNNLSNTSKEMAKITIDTVKKTRTYDVMPDVDEDTLKHDLGHLPTSAMPGQDGLCVIMGHRDTQFAILQYCEIGDSITIKYNDMFIVYKVYAIEIVDNDSSLQFNAVNGANLALVTCYPFRYTGNAPQKTVVYAKIR